MKKLLLPVLVYLMLYNWAFGQVFDIYVCDGGNFNNPPWQILKFDEKGKNPQVFINQELSWPQDIVFLEDQNRVIISNLNTGRITRYLPNSGSYVDDFASGIAGATRMKIGEDDLLYVLQWGGSGTVLRYQQDGTFVDEFTETGVNTSIGIDWDSDGNLYVSSYADNLIRKFGPDGSDMGNFIDTNLEGPTNIWFDENGDLYVNNWNGTTVKRFNSDGEFIEEFITGLSNPEGIAFYPNGDILIGNGGTSAVKRFDSEGNFIEDIIESGSGNLLLPNAVVLRAQKPQSTTEIQRVDNILQTNLGTTFYLNAEYVGQIESVEIYDNAGQLVIQRVLGDDLVWNAQRAAIGMYIIKAQTKKGEVYSQKIIVQE
ncbi:MAG: T9SS type A sorting domain-containing protein [Bacteroidota bacterium]